MLACTWSSVQAWCERRTGGGIEIAAVDPVSSMQAIENRKLGEIAGQVRSIPKSVVQRT